MTRNKSPTNNYKQLLGRQGEDIAAQYLKTLNWRIVATRFRTCNGEVDLVGRDKSTLVFVEVKTRTSNTFGNAVEAISPLKLFRLSRVAEQYLQQYNWKGDFRIDVIGIEWPLAQKDPNIHHLKDVTF